MQKTIFSTLLFIMLTANLVKAKDINKDEVDLAQEIMKMQQQVDDENKKQKIEKLKQAKLLEEQKVVKAKTKNVKELGKTVDKLAKKIGLDE